MHGKPAGSGLGTVMPAGHGCGPLTTGGAPPHVVEPGKIGQFVGPTMQPVVPGMSTAIGPSGHGWPESGSWRTTARPRPLVVPFGVMTVSQPRVVDASPIEPT